MAKEKKEEEFETQNKEENNEEKGSDTSQIQFQQFEEKVTKLLDKWGTEIGKDRKERENLYTEIGTIKQYFENQNRKAEETEFDPYDKDKLVDIFGQVVDQKLKPFQDQFENSQKQVMTVEGFQKMLQDAQRMTTIKGGFKLNDKEYNELVKESEEAGKDIEIIAWEKYGKRKFDENFNKELSKERKKNDNPPPPESSSESIFEKLGIPTNARDYERMHEEKGGEEMRKLIREATRPKE